MTDALWLFGFAAVTLFGLSSWRLGAVAALDLPARIAVAFAAGSVFTGALMFVYSVGGMGWTRATIALPLLGVSAAALWRRRRAEARRSTVTRDVWSGGLQPAVAVLIALILLITIYGIATARETCGDLLYFWGPKAQAFHTAGKVDVDFLGWEHHYLMHPDYPPLLPLVYAWASTVAHRFSWWGALFTMPLLLLLTGFGLRGFAREQLGAERAGWFAMLMTALLAYGYAVGMVAGAADPMLIFFEVLALAALTFGDDAGGLKAAAPQSTWSGGLQPAGAWKGLQPAGAHLVAAIALGGAAWTKIEGAAFASIVLVAYALARRRFRPLLTLALPTVVLLGAWLAFIRHHHLVDQYGRAGQKIHLDLLGRVIAKTAASVKYDAWYLPWLAVLAPLACGRRWRRAALPLLTAAGTMASAVYFYLHNPDPWWWIESSAERVFLTPLACLAVAAAAASE